MLNHYIRGCANEGRQRSDRLRFHSFGYNRRAQRLIVFIFSAVYLQLLQLVQCYMQVNDSTALVSTTHLIFHCYCIKSGQLCTDMLWETLSYYELTLFLMVGWSGEHGFSSYHVVCVV